MTFLAAGATCVSMDISARELLLTVRLAADGPRPVARDDDRTVASRPSRARRLTPRETQVLEHLAKGRTGAQIAHALHIDPETVKTHAARVYRKLNVDGKRELVDFPISSLLESQV
jgi:two-component system, NarL family, invasion response regulator UvrY